MFPVTVITYKEESVFFTSKFRWIAGCALVSKASRKVTAKRNNGLNNFDMAISLLKFNIKTLFYWGQTFTVIADHIFDIAPQFGLYASLHFDGLYKGYFI